MINRTKVKESTQIKPGDNGDVLVMKDNAPEWSTPSDADLAKASDTDAKLAEKQDKLTAGDNIHIVGNTISADGEPTPIAIGTVTSGEVPMVSNSGTDTDVVLNFVLPKGDKGDKGDQGLEGPQGPVGAPFQVKKIYDSVEAMNADYSGSDVAVGEFVLIDTGDVQDPDNSKLYVKGDTQYDFVTDLSGAQGIQGPQGNPGAAAGFGNVTATVDNTTGTPQVSVQADGPNTAKNISFSFMGLKGEKGDPGKDGTQVNNLSPLVVETAPSVVGGRVGLAIGDGAVADGGVAIGYSANAGNLDAIAIGGNATANKAGALAIGRAAEANSTYTIAIGSGSSSTAYSVAVGRDAAAENMFSTALGYNSYSNGNAVATGASSYSSDNSVAVGQYSSAGGSSVVTVGTESGIVSTTKIDYGDDEWYNIGNDSVAIGRGALVAGRERNVVSFGKGGITEYWARQPGSSVKHVTRALGPDTRRLINVTDPTNAQDAATKNYVDTQLAPVNAKLQYVPENTNQILSQIQTNVEKAQSAADAKVASITAGTGITIDDSNPTAPVVSTTGLATQASVDALTTTVNSKADQTELDSLEATVANKADTSALANYATKTELATKADQADLDALETTVAGKADTSALAGYATKAELADKANQTDLDSLETTVAENSSSISALQTSVAGKQDKLSNSSITTNLIADDAVTSAKLADNAIQAVFDAIYPIGIIVSGAKPSLGTWEKVEGRFLLGSSSSHAAGSTGGEEMHELTTNEMPLHNHTTQLGAGSYVTIDDGASTTYKIAYGDYVNVSWGPNSGKYTGNTGSGAAHNNMPPYLTVDMWKRTA